jgi:acetyl esterase
MFTERLLVMLSPVDLKLQAVFEKLKESGVALPDPAEVGLVAGRKAREKYYAFLNQPDEKIPMQAIKNISLPGPYGPILIRLYFPTNEESIPVTLFVHGGGWWTGNVEAYDHICRRLAMETNCAVASVEYRLWPEYRFPVPIEETMLAAEWILNEGKLYGLDSTRIAFCGDSAGATICLYAGSKLKSNKSLKALALVYGVYSVDLDTPSWIQIGDGTYGLTVKQMQWIWDGYLDGQDINPKDPRLSPINADLNGLAPTWIMVGDLDPLLDDNLALNKALEFAGVEHVFKVEEGLTHFVWMWQRLYERSRQSIAEASSFLKKYLRE